MSWKNNKIFSIPDAFLKAWEAMPLDKVHGTSIVIWMGRSVFESGSKSIKQDGVEIFPCKEEGVSPKEEEGSQMNPIQVDLEVPEEINYSLLHNNRPLLDKLTLTRLVRETVHAISRFRSSSVSAPRTIPTATRSLR